MKKTLLGLFIAISIFFVFSCVSASPDSNSTSRTIIGAEGDPRPNWVRNPGDEETEDFAYFVGEGRAGQTATARKNTALEDARRQIVEWKKSLLEGMIDDYIKESGTTGRTKSIEGLEIKSTSLMSENTSGAKIKESWIDPDGNYIALVQYPKNDVLNDFSKAYNDYIQAEETAFAEFESERAYDKMIDRLNNRMKNY